MYTVVMLGVRAGLFSVYMTQQSAATGHCSVYTVVTLGVRAGLFSVYGGDVRGKDCSVYTVVMLGVRAVQCIRW